MKKACLSLIICSTILLMSACSSNSENKIPKTKDGKEIITISTIVANELLKQAEKKYERKNPSIDIQINEHLNGADLNDNVKKMNTEFLSGKGADLIVDFIPQEYVDKGFIANLDEMIQKDPTFDKNNYYTNILDNSKVNGNLYAMPLRFFLETLYGDEEAIQKSGISIPEDWTWSQFISIGEELVEKGPHKQVLGNTPQEFMLNYLIQDQYDLLLNKENNTANFQSGLFIRMLEQVKQMYDQKIVTSTEVVVGDSYFLPGFILSPEDYFIGPKSLYSTGKSYQKPKSAEQKKGTVFRANTSIAINAKSLVKKEAWDFMKFLMSEEFQDEENIQGFPINKKSLNKQIEEIKKKRSVEHPDGSKIPITEKELNNLNQMVSGANVKVTGDDTIDRIISEESKMYFNGHKTAKDVAELIQNRVTTYLNE